MDEQERPKSAYDALKIAEADFLNAKKSYDDAVSIRDRQKQAKLRTFLEMADENVGRLRVLAADEEGKRRSRILEELRTGSYAAVPLVPEPGVPEPQKPGNPLRNKLAELYRTTPEQVDISSGLPSSIRTRMSVASDQQRKFEFLSSKYGGNNVSPLNIAGKPNFAVRKRDGSIVLADELGASWGDLADVAADSARMGGEVVASAVASFMAKRPVATYALSSGVANLILGTGQDVAANKLSGRELDIVDEFVSQLPEAAITGGADYVGGKIFSWLPYTSTFGTKVASKLAEKKESLVSAIGKVSPRTGDILSKMPAGKRFSMMHENEYAKSIDEAVGRLQRENIIRQAPLGPAMRSQEATEAQQLAAGLFPTTTLRKKTDEVLDMLYDWQRVRLGERMSPQAEYEKVLNTIQGKAETMFGELRVIDSNLARAYRDVYEQRTREFVNGRMDKETLGNTLRGIVKSAEEKETLLKNEAYDGFYSRNSHIQISPEEALDVFKSAYREAEKQGLENATAASIVGRLEARVKNTKLLARLEANVAKLQASGSPIPPSAASKIEDLRTYSGPLDLRTFRNYMNRIGDPIPATGAVAQGTPVQSAAITSSGVGRYWNKLLSSNGIADEFAAINRRYNENSLLFKRNSVGAIAKDTLGDSSLSDGEMVLAAIRNPRSVDDVLRAVHMDNPENYDSVLSGLQRAYLDQAGIHGIGATSGKLNHDPNMLAALWGRKPDGSVSFQTGERMADYFDRLSKAFQKANLEPDKITPDDVNELAGITMSGAARDTAIRMIVERQQKVVQMEEQLGTKLLSLAQSGKLKPEILTSDEFAKALFGGNKMQVRNIMAALPESQKNIVRQDFVANMMARYRSSPYQSRTGGDLWNADKLLSDFARKPAREANARTVLGDDFIDNLKAASLVLKTTAPKRVAQMKAEIKASYVPGGKASLYSVSPITKWGYHRFLAAAYGSGVFQKIVRQSALSGVPIDPDQGFRVLAPILFSTSRGVEALAIGARNDPDFHEWVSDKIFSMGQEEKQYKELMGKLGPPVESGR